MFNDEFIDELEVLQNHEESSDSKTSFLAPDLDSYPKAVKELALKKLKLVLYVRKHLNNGWTERNLNPLIEEFISTNPDSPNLSWRTLIRWHKTLEHNNNNPVVLIQKDHQKGNRKSKLNINNEDYFDEAINRFLRAERPTIASAYRFYKDRVLLNISSNDSSLKPMSKNAFYKRIDKLNSYEIALKRYGKHKADMMFGYKGGTIKPERIMQRVEIDHTPLDLILLDDITEKPIGKPYLTLLKDVFSGCLVGYHLTFKAPSYASVVKAVCHTLLPKSQSQELWGIEWLCYGKIEVLVTDNAAEFWAKSLDQTCLELGINIQYNQVGKPWLKPFIERNFKTINDLLLDEQKGKTFRSMDVRGEYDSVKNATIKFGDFVHGFEKWMAEVYNCSPDSRGLRVPSLLWQEGFEKLPPAELNEQEVMELPKLTGLKVSRVIQSSGITYHYLRYDSDALSDYRKSYLSPNRPKSVNVKVDIDDVSKIYVYLPELKQYLTVPCVDQVYTRYLSLDQHLINMSFTRAKNRLNGKSDKDLAASREEIREILAGHDAKIKTSTKVTTNKKAAQYKGYSSETVRNAGNADKVSPTHEPKAPDSSDDVSELEALWQSFNKD
jgi:putative transposase